MARNAEPLLRPQPLPELHDGVELLIVESVLAHPDPSQEVGYEEERSLCVLLLVVPTEGDRRRLRIEGARYIGARASVVPVVGAEWAEGVADVLNGLNAALVDVVVSLPEHRTAVESQVASLMQQLRTGHHQLCIAVAVAQDPRPWAKLDDWLRFVAPLDPALGEAALLLHAGLAQLAAPTLIECVASDDIEATFGDAANPASLIVIDGDHADNALATLATMATEATGGHAAAFYLSGVGLAGYRLATRSLAAAGFNPIAVIAPDGLTLPLLAMRGRPCILVLRDGVHAAMEPTSRGKVDGQPAGVKP